MRLGLGPSPLEREAVACALSPSDVSVSPKRGIWHHLAERPHPVRRGAGARPLASPVKEAFTARGGEGDGWEWALLRRKLRDVTQGWGLSRGSEQGPGAGLGCVECVWSPEGARMVEWEMEQLSIALPGAPRCPREPLFHAA